MKRMFLYAFSLAAVSAGAQMLDILDKYRVQSVDEVHFKSDNMKLDKQTGAAKASGHVQTEAKPYRLWSDELTHTEGGLYDFGDAKITTCTNSEDSLHWFVRGNFRYQDHHAFYVRDAWAYWQGIPLGWFPYWCYRTDTNTGWRTIPGYRSRWGFYLLNAYLYNLYDGGPTNNLAFSGKTRFDIRTRNGVAVGQSLYWKLGDFGRGKFSFYNAWDDDYDRYNKYSEYTGYGAFGKNDSDIVNRERYRFTLEHHAEFTERDIFNLQAKYYADPAMQFDFFRDEEHDWQGPVNEMWYEHLENDWSFGGSMSGPLNKFYAGTQRLPEGWLAIEPQPIFETPLIYESETRAGYFNRRSRNYENTDEIQYKYFPFIGIQGNAADYNAFRADSYHRMTLPTKVGDVLSFVPRAGYRVTYWSDSGYANSGLNAGVPRASDEQDVRNIGEVGFTLSARGTSWLNDDWRHTIEPYLDYTCQKASYTQGNRNRRYIFDSYDGSVDWLDQFGFDGHTMPYSWHGVHPGIRNIFQRRDEDGILRTVFDFDFYLAVPFDDESYYAMDEHADPKVLIGPKDLSYGNYARSKCVVPGFKLKYNPDKDTSISGRVEYDCENDKFSYVHFSYLHRIAENLSARLSYVGRNSRLTDYVPAAKIPMARSTTDRYNYELLNYIYGEVQYQPADWCAFSPFVSYDCRNNQAIRVGLWFDYLTDCLGYRVTVEEEEGCREYNGYRRDSDVNVMFQIYLRALGPSSILDLGKF